MTKEDLAAMGVLGENKLEEYGDRLIRQITAFVKKENLTEYVKSRPNSKRAKQADGTAAEKKILEEKQPAKTGSHVKKEIIEIDDEDDDEFDDCDIDFAAIELPKVPSTQSKSSYFN